MTDAELIVRCGVALHSGKWGWRTAVAQALGITPTHVARVAKGTRVLSEATRRHVNALIANPPQEAKADPELAAMETVRGALAPLPPDVRKRVLAWAAERWGA